MVKEKTKIGTHLYLFQLNEPGDVYSLEEDFIEYNEKFVGIYGANSKCIIAVRKDFLNKLYKAYKDNIQGLVLTDKQMDGIDDSEWYKQYESATMYIIQLIVPSQTENYCMDLVRFLDAKQQKTKF